MDLWRRKEKKEDGRGGEESVQRMKPERRTEKSEANIFIIAHFLLYSYQTYRIFGSQETLWIDEASFSLKLKQHFSCF